MVVEMCVQNIFFDFTKHLDTFFKKSVSLKGNKWAITSYKIFAFSSQSKCVTVSEYCSGIATYNFPPVKTGKLTSLLLILIWCL
jgi:hypothetical protein